METPWIQQAAHYHSIEIGVKEYHDGGWTSYEGGTIRAQHLVDGMGTGRTQCPVCAEEANRSK
jgi:hypothetical protein